MATGKKIVPIHQHSIKFGNGVPVSPWLYGTCSEKMASAHQGNGQRVCALDDERAWRERDRRKTIQEACSKHRPSWSGRRGCSVTGGECRPKQSDSTGSGKQFRAVRGGGVKKRARTAALPRMELLRIGDQAWRALEYLVKRIANQKYQTLLFLPRWGEIVVPLATLCGNRR